MAYSKVRFVAFNIRPGTGTDSTGAPTYLGEKKAEDDITVRCDVMKAAIRAAYKLVTDAEKRSKPVAPKRGKTTSTVDDAKPLKIFMAPEFYFRGSEGAYPMESISLIMDKMKEETDKAEPAKPKTLTYDYSDWLFVFGTAIGYLRHDQADATVKAVRKDIDGKTIVTVDSILEGPRENLVVAASRPPAQITSIAVPASDKPELTLSAPVPAGWSVKTAGPGTSAGGPFAVSSAAGAKATLACPQGLCPLKDCKCDLHFVWSQQPCPKCKHWHLPFDVGATVNFIDFRAKVLTVADAVTVPTITVTAPDSSVAKIYKPAKLYDLKLDTRASFLVGDKVSVERADKGVSELLNVALVRKGGKPKTGSSGLRDTVVYKEYVSHIDYNKPKPSSSAPAPDWDDSSGSGRTILLHGSEVTALPTSGSRDLLAANPNVSGTTKIWTDKEADVHTQRISEINEKGGGGGVFTIDDITYGLEVCLDHGKNRLFAFYNDHFVCPDCKEVTPSGGACKRHSAPAPAKVATPKGAVAGDPKVQILLIPSWGMTIGGGEVCCVDDGLIFNVDGSRCDSTVRHQDGNFACDDHHSVTASSPKDCGRHFVCWTCSDLRTREQLNAGKCPRCGGVVAPYPVYLTGMGSLVSKQKSQAIDLSAARADWGKYFNDSKSPGLVLYNVRDIPPAAKV